MRLRLLSESFPSCLQLKQLKQCYKQISSMIVPRPGNVGMKEDEEVQMMVEKERMGYMCELEEMEKTGLREEQNEEEIGSEKVVVVKAQSGHLFFLLALLLSVALLAIGFLVSQVN